MHGRPGGPGVEKPWVLVAGVIGDQIQDHLDVSPARLRDQLIEGFHIPEDRLDGGVVGDVVAEVLVR